jgi:hypothetical protein
MTLMRPQNTDRAPVCKQFLDSRLSRWTFTMRSLRLSWLIAFMCLSRCLAQPAPETQPHHFEKWGKSIAAFEEKDRASPPPRSAIVFTGASTITRWKTLEQDFPDQKILNRGFSLPSIDWGAQSVCETQC